MSDSSLVCSPNIRPRPSEFSFSKSVKDPDTASSLCPCVPPPPLFNFPAPVNMKTDNKNNANILCSQSFVFREYVFSCGDVVAICLSST